MCHIVNKLSAKKALEQDPQAFLSPEFDPIENSYQQKQLQSLLSPELDPLENPYFEQQSRLGSGVDSSNPKGLLPAELDPLENPWIRQQERGRWKIRYPVRMASPAGAAAEAGHDEEGHKPGFCYDREICGPGKWKDLCQTGKSQSPINLDSTKATKKKRWSPLWFNKEYRNMSDEMFITNNDYTIMVQLQKNGLSKAAFSHTDKGSNYIFSQLHFHWSEFDDKGSEHRLDNKSFAMEFHMVHFKEQYKTLTKAFAAEDDTAAAVIGVFVKLGKRNRHLQAIVDATENRTLLPTDRMQNFKGKLKLYNLLPRRGGYFRYKGSLTVPACTEKILWVMYDTPIEISKQQMDIFRRVYATHEGSHKMNNFRPVQPLNDRKLEHFRCGG